ncbi:type II toxin-antitoxin system death-on-curing family toxin [Pannus brasiliensis CCIBt3594]|uniref:Type II toxin-antitoxin system death-on-curing family toxin n=1 Tax=Pannus brasiliensis CCIBt3594 TaxID=1427578 RepID=A0AAW9QSG6_9CHRO
MPIPKFLSESVVLKIHERQIERFGGSQGVRDRGLLESALAQPRMTFGGELLHPTIAEQAAAYLYHIAMNHPFIDGNKRTAFAVMDTFLRLNCYRLNLDNESAYNLVLRVVERGLDKAELIEYLEESIEPLD